MLGLMLGLLVGVGGAAVGIYFALKGAGCFQYMGGQKPAATPAISKEMLRARIQSLNDPARPYHIVDGENTDQLAEWKIVDAKWHGIFNKNRLKKAYRAYLLLDESRRSVRCYEELGSVSWSAGTQGLTPRVHFQRSFFGGRILFKKEYGIAYGLKDAAALTPGQAYQYHFDVDEIRNPIMTAVKASGWEWVPVTARRHAVYPMAGKARLVVAPSPAQSSLAAEACFCGRCGSQARAGSSFCSKCGNRLR